MRSFSNPVCVHFGPGCFSRLGEALGARETLLLTTAGAERRGIVEAVRSLAKDRVRQVYTRIRPNPTVASVNEAAKALAASDADVILAVGGGSVLDTAKAVAAQLSPGVPEDWISDHLRVGAPFPEGFSPLPVIAVPTTAGTGSEVTMWGTIWDEASKKKYSLSHPALYPQAALVDPELTLDVPPDVMIATALDALSHACEAVWSRNHNPASDALALRAIAVIPAALRAASRCLGDLRPREELHDASLCAGLAFSNTRTALAHSISYPLTAEWGVPHGIACSFTLPEVLELNGGADPARGLLVAEALGCESVAMAREKLYGLLGEFQVGARLQECIPTEAHLRATTGSLLTTGRADNNLAEISSAGARELAARAYRRVCANDLVAAEAHR